MKKVVLFFTILCMVFTGCQKTPEKSSVASKADGLSKDIIVEPLKDGEKRTINMPDHWKMNEKKSNGRVTIMADLDLEKMEVGNLPVIEMSNHELSQEELKNLVSYFVKNQKLYMPQIYTKDIYQSVLDRIENKRGAYTDLFMWTVYEELDGAMKKAVELAPEITLESEKAEIKFQKKTNDLAFTAAQDWSGGKKEELNTNVENYFLADVGTDRTAHIEAERYDSKLENSSNFSWQQGARVIGADDIQYHMKHGEYKRGAGLDTSGYTEKFEKLLCKYEKCLNQQEGIDEAKGRKQAEQVLQDLKIKDMEFTLSDKVLWFPNGAYPKEHFPGYGEDHLWQADLTKAEVGYQYIFSPYIEGIPAKKEYGTVPEKTRESYKPPFPVESITITVTKDGIKGFQWEGMADEVKRIANNTHLQPFETIQNELVDQVFYLYSQMGQPENDTTLFDYNITGVDFEYTYIPAYGEPLNAWLVPAWVFTVTETSKGLERPGYDSFVLNALDGGVIGRVDR